MFERIQSFFTQKKQQRAIDAAIAQVKKEEPESEAERLAKASCDWVELLWNGSKQKFFIHKTNFYELLTCGRFPNVLYKFVKGIAKSEEAKDIVLSDVDLKKMKEEEDEFIIELAKKSMVTPTYQECYDAILKVRGMSESDINDVIPRDFLSDFFLFYLTDLEATVKKNSEKYSLPASDGLPNTTDAAQATTSEA